MRIERSNMRTICKMNLKIGNTPIIELTKEIRAQNGVRIFAKMENANDGGSIKSRVALALVQDAEKKGVLKKGGTIVEATSGNTGVGLALVGKSKGYKARIYLPENMQGDKSAKMESYGAEVVLTPAVQGMAGAVRAAESFVQTHPNVYYVNQFCNPVCAAVHYQTTGVEIWAQTQGGADIFAAGFGTGGTISGVGKYLKEKKPTLQVVGIEPASSPLLSKGYSGAHGIKGIGANFLPSVLNKSVIDEVLLVTDSEAEEWSARLKRDLGLSVGISSGAAFCACLRLAEMPQNAGKRIVTIFPDGGGRYAVE